MANLEASRAARPGTRTSKVAYMEEMDEWTGDTVLNSQTYAVSSAPAPWKPNDGRGKDRKDTPTSLEMILSIIKDAETARGKEDPELRRGVQAHTAKWEEESDDGESVFESSLKQKRPTPRGKKSLPSDASSRRADRRLENSSYYGIPEGRGEEVHRSRKTISPVRLIDTPRESLRPPPPQPYYRGPSISRSLHSPAGPYELRHSRTSPPMARKVPLPPVPPLSSSSSGHSESVDSGYGSGTQSQASVQQQAAGGSGLAKSSGLPSITEDSSERRRSVYGRSYPARGMGTSSADPPTPDIATTTKQLGGLSLHAPQSTKNYQDDRLKRRFEKRSSLGTGGERVLSLADARLQPEHVRHGLANPPPWNSNSPWTPLEGLYSQYQGSLHPGMVRSPAYLPPMSPPQQYPPVPASFAAPVVMPQLWTPPQPPAPMPVFPPRRISPTQTRPSRDSVVSTPLEDAAPAHPRSKTPADVSKLLHGSDPAGKGARSSRQRGPSPDQSASVGDLESRTSEETESSESGSLWLTSEYSDDTPTLEENHPFLRVKGLAIKAVLDAFRAWQRCPADAQGCSETASSPQGGSGGKGPSKKRPRRGGAADGGADNHAEDDSVASQKVSNKRRRTADRKLTFACPFSKKEPMRYRDCYKYMLTRIRDVKQHLMRCHRVPLYCPRCMETFADEEARDDHIRDAACPARPKARLDGVTESQRNQLARKSPSNLSKEDQWFAVFDILFPGCPRPQSPYIDNELLQDITLYQDFLATRGPAILSDLLTLRGAVRWNLPNEERDLAAFQQTIFEEGFRVIFQQWASQNGIALAESSAGSSWESIALDGALHTPPSSADSLVMVQGGRDRPDRRRGELGGGAAGAEAEDAPSQEEFGQGGGVTDLAYMGEHVSFGEDAGDLGNLPAPTADEDEIIQMIFSSQADNSYSDFWRGTFQ